MRVLKLPDHTRQCTGASVCTWQHTQSAVWNETLESVRFYSNVTISEVFQAEIWQASAYNSIVENYGCHLWFVQKLKAGERKTFAPRGWATVKEKKRGGVGAMAYVHNYWQNRGDMTQEGIDTNLKSLVSGNTLAKNQIWFGWERNTVEFIIFLVTWCSKAGEFFLSSPFHSCVLGCRAFLQEWG